MVQGLLPCCMTPDVSIVFEGYEREQLAITSIDFVARKP
jgi:hypothetical protein